MTDPRLQPLRAAKHVAEVYGPPGTGKTALAESVTVELDRPIVEIRCQDVLARYLGESEIHRLSPPVGTATDVMILACYPSRGAVDVDTTSHHNVCISERGARVHAKGYRDGDLLPGFSVAGTWDWYDGIYWRTVGDHPNRFLSGGVQGNDYKFRVNESEDFGVSGKCATVKLPDVGIVFCRGVGDDDDADPEMACVLFNEDGSVRDRYAYRGLLGRWLDIIQ
ncbi:hypothetical protein PINS_up003003 [Pythium insidiosum]|nr:hypothetical protein PINS_up003003 [Pythium insidiosum]